MKQFQIAPSLAGPSLAALLLTAPGAHAAAYAASAADPGDAPVATADQTTSSPTDAPPAAAPAAPKPSTAAPTVAEQIDDFIRASPAALPANRAAGVVAAEAEEEPHKVHGVVDVSAGSHGYRSAYARSDFPIGKTGTLSIAVGETKTGRGWGWGGGYPYGGYPYGGYGYGSPYAYGGTTQSLAVGLHLGPGGADGDRDGRCRTAWSDRRFSADEMLPVSADRFSDCLYPPTEGPPDGR